MCCDIFVVWDFLLEFVLIDLYLSRFIMCAPSFILIKFLLEQPQLNFHCACFTAGSIIKIKILFCSSVSSSFNRCYCCFPSLITPRPHLIAFTSLPDNKFSYKLAPNIPYNI